MAELMIAIVEIFSVMGLYIIIQPRYLEFYGVEFQIPVDRNSTVGFRDGLIEIPATQKPWLIHP